MPASIMRASDLPLQYNAAEILEHNLAHSADRVALLSLERTMTFGEVAQEANQVTNALRQMNVRVGECVGILAPDCAEWVIALCGILKAGGVAICMNTLLTPLEFAYMLRDSRARIAIVHHSLLAPFEQARSQTPCLEHVIVINGGGSEVGYHDWIRGESTQSEAAPTHRDDFGTLNYSSGTTGEPKGVFHAHKDYTLTAQLVGANILEMRPDDRTFSNAKLFFVYGLGGNLFFPWYVGASTVLFSGSPRDTVKVLEMIERFRPTVFFNTPTGYGAMLRVEDLTTKYDLKSLRLCVSAGEALPAPIWHAWKERTGVDIIDGIGSTENFHVFLSNRPGDIRPGSSGKPVPGYEVKIVDEEGRSVPQGTVGNLLVRGETAALSYLHQYERSRATFLGEWLYTGDKYYVDPDGYYWHAGRSDDMLKVGGIWVSPVEVESTLLEHAAVAECAVIGVPDEAGLTKPKAWVVLKQGHAASAALEATLIAHCAEKMAVFKRPRWIEFIDEMPKTATGKIQRFKLRNAGGR